MEDKKQRIILGLDVSTKCVGVTIAKFDGEDSIEILCVTHIRPKTPSKITGVEELLIKSRIIKDKLAEYSSIGITDIVIEEPLIGSNNSSTVATLLRFNGMITENVYEEFGVVPSFISSYNARKFGVPELMAVRKFNKNGDIYDTKKLERALKKGETVLFGAYPFDCAKKLILWNIVSERFPDIEWVYNKKGDLVNENFDASDSLVCVLGYVNMLKFGDSEPKVPNFSKEEDDEKIEYSYTVNFCGQTFKKSLVIPKSVQVESDLTKINVQSEPISE